MSTITQHAPALRPELHRLLDRLRCRIRSYVLLEGLALVAALLGGLFWLSLGLDWGYFKLTNLELPVGVRAGIDLLAIGVVALALVAYLLLRLTRRLRTRALALVLERRFPELNDRLILAVEQADALSAAPINRVTERLRERAVDDVARAADRLDVADVFDRAPLRHNITAAAALLAPMLVLAVLAPPVLATWWDAYGRLGNNYHARDTTLTLTVLAPPDDRPRALLPGEAYKHPRGANLDILIDVPEGSRADGQPWTVPQTVYARRRTDAGAKQTLPAVQAGERRFRLSIDEVRDSMDLWMTGGDYTNAVPFRIEVVDPPRVERVELQNLYPAYTRLNGRDDAGTLIPETVVLAGAVAEVPQGTRVLFVARSNKPIRNARIRLGEADLEFGEFDAGETVVIRGTLTMRASEAGSGSVVNLPPEVVAAMIAPDGRSVAVPLLVTADQSGYLPAGPADRPDLPATPVIVVSAETAVRVGFEDTDRVVSLDPSRFDLRGVADAPPEIKAAKTGVSDIITRTAVIPVRGSLRDDYGLAAAQFEYGIDAATDWKSRPLANPPKNYPKEFRLRRSVNASVEWFDTATLDLKLGQKLTLSVVASDADTLTGPHIARGDAFTFTIVTREELLGALYNQEINLRKRFEQSLGEMRAVRADLEVHRQRAAEVQAGSGTPADAEAIRSAADRSLTDTQQNGSEVAAVTASFGEILEQLINNRVHTEKQLDRIRAGILDPLKRLTDSRFPTLDRALGVLRLRIADGAEAGPAFAASIDAADAIVAEMEAALKEMQDLADFHEAIQDLAAIFEDQGEVLDRTKEEQKKSVIDSLGDLLD